MTKVSFVSRLPILLAPMGGGPGTVELAAAVSNAGGLGSVGSAYFSIPELENAFVKIRQLTDQPFGFNIFINQPAPNLDLSLFEEVSKATDPILRQFNIIPEPPMDPFAKIEDQMRVILRERPRVLSFVFGTLPDHFIRECKSAGILTVGTATQLSEALALQQSGVDAVIAQGCGAGGHRGMFNPDEQDPNLTTEQLTKLLVKSLRVPVIAAGGLMSGSDIQRALSWGAVAVQMGTAFLLCSEAGTSSAYARALLQLKNNAPILTKIFSGRWARGLENQFTKTMRGKAHLPWPLQNDFTRNIRAVAQKENNFEFLSLWAGDQVSRIREMPAQELIRHLVEELRQASAKN